MRSNLLIPPDGQQREASSFDSLAKPNNADPFTSLADCLRQLPSDLAGRLSPLADQFGVKRIGTALRKASALLNDVAHRAPAALGVEAAMNVLEATSRIEGDVRTAVDFASRLVSGDTLGASAPLTRAALEHLLDGIPEGVAKMAQVSKTLSTHRKPSASSVRDVLQRVRAAASPAGEAALTVIGEDVAHLVSPIHMEIARVPQYCPSAQIQTVAEVLSAHEDLALDNLLLTTSARFVGKDGEVYALQIPAHKIKLNESDDRAHDLVLAYGDRSGCAHVGSIANYIITGVKGTHGSSARVTRYPLAGADVATSGSSEGRLEVNYRGNNTPEKVGASVVSELLGLSGARTALPPFLAQVIERTRALPPEERVQVLCSAFFKRDYVYSKDESLHTLIDNLPKPLRLSFLAGLRIGSCHTMSCELQNFLALAGIPAIVEGGALYDPDRHAFCTPGHDRVRCLTDPQLVIDPTRWTTSEFEVTTPSDALSHEILTTLSGKNPADAFALGVTLRSELLYKPQPNEIDATNSTSREIRGHNLSDDFERRSLLTYQWDIEMDAAQLAVWSELIEEEVREGGEAFFAKFYLSEALHDFLKQANESAIAGTRTLFTDWVLAYLHHPRQVVAECVRHPVYCMFEAGYTQEVHEAAWATFLFLADHIDPRATKGWGEGPLGGDHVRQFLTVFAHSYHAETNTCKVEELFVRVAAKQLKSWGTDLHKSGSSEDEQAFAGFARRLIELSARYSPEATALLQRAVADALQGAGDSALFAFMAGLDARLEANDNSVLEVHLSLGPVPEPVRLFVGQYFSQAAASSDLPVRAFERSKHYLDVMFREGLRKAVDQKLTELVNRELGRSDIYFYPSVRGSEDTSLLRFQTELYRNVDAFSLHIGCFLRYFTENDFVRFSQSDTFKEALRSASLEALEELLCVMQTLAYNFADWQQQSLASVFTDFIEDLLEEFSIPLPERSELIRGRDAILARGIHSRASEYFIPNSTDTSSTKVATRLAYLLEGNLIQGERLSAFERPIEDSRVAREVCSFLTEELKNFKQPSEGLLRNLTILPQSSHSALVPRRWVPLVLQSLKEEIAALPSPLGEAVRVVAELTTTDEDRALWRALQTHTPDQLSNFLGSLPEYAASNFFSRMIIHVLDPEKCSNILTYAYLMGLEGKETTSRGSHTSEMMQQAVRRFLPKAESEAHVKAIGNFLYSFSDAANPVRHLLQEFALRNPFTCPPLHKRLQELRASDGGPVRAHLWKLAHARHEPDIESLSDSRPVSPALWRSALGRAASQHNRTIIRSLLGSADPYEVESLSPYTRGDDVRLIAWRASARADRLFIKKPERTTPVDSKTITVCVDRSDMGFSPPLGYWVVNKTFIDDLVGFVRSMVVDGKTPSLTLFSYGVPDLVLTPSQVRSLFFDNGGNAARALLLRDARRAAESACHFGFPAKVARACPTVAREAEAQLLEAAKTSLILMLTASVDGRSRNTAPSTQIWNDPFSLYLMEHGKAVRVSL